MAKKKSKLSDCVDTASSPVEDKAQVRKYEIENALRTVQRAEEIKRDKAMMKDVKAMARSKIKEMKKIC